MAMQKVDLAQADDIANKLNNEEKNNSAPDHVLVDDASSTNSDQSDAVEAVVVVEPSPVADDTAVGEAEEGANEDVDAAGATTIANKKRKLRPMKKDPRAPKRFRSSYIFFSQDRFPEIRDELKSEGIQVETVHITKMVSEEWKNLGHEERERYEEMSRKDKERFEVEKKMYSGTWHVPTTQKLTKDETAPKRPASAFLMFSNPRRAALKKERSDLTNGDISKLLSKMWKEATPEERKPYEDEEIKRRNQYKEEVAVWREGQEAILQERQDKAMKMAESGVSGSDLGESIEEVAGGKRDSRAARDDDPREDSPPEVVYSGTNPAGLPFMVDSRGGGVAFPPSAALLHGRAAALAAAGGSWGAGALGADFATGGGYYPPPGGEGTILQRVHGVGPRYLLQRPSPFITYEQDPSLLVHPSHRAAALAAAGAPPHVLSAAAGTDPSLLYAASGLVGMSGLPPARSDGGLASAAATAAAALGDSASPPITFVNENGIPMMLRAVPIPMGGVGGAVGAPEYTGSLPPGIASRFPPGFIPPPGFGTVIGGGGRGAQPPLEAFPGGTSMMMGQRLEQGASLRHYSEALKGTSPTTGARAVASKKTKKEGGGAPSSSRTSSSRGRGAMRRSN